MEATSIGFTDENLAKAADLEKIKKIYKLNSSRPKGRGGTSEATNGVAAGLDRKEVEIFAVGMMALRGQT